MLKFIGISICINKCIIVLVDKIVYNVKYILLFVDCFVLLLIFLFVISGFLICNLGLLCLVLICCVYVELLFKYVIIVLNLDFCNDKMIVGIDRFFRDIRFSIY